MDRYMLVQHRDNDEFKPIGDITATIEMVAEQLLSPKHRIPIVSEDVEADGVILKIRRAMRRGDPKLLEEAIEKYNKLIRTYRKSGVLQKNIEKLGKSGMGIPLAFSEHVLAQSYARSVALEVDALRKYEAFSNNVYGELLPKFTSKLFKEAKLRPDQVFVDLGSGTGNVVLHAAIEVGCESWGCEMMEKACELADAQAREFEARCILWGLKPGKVTLEKGDFLENEAIANVLRRADVLLVNNYAFDSSLNARLIDMFLDLKEGTQIISLKSFVPPNHVITPRNVDSPVNLLRVEEKEYFSGCVSWTNAPGRYYVATVDRSMLRAFLDEH
ncbi:histone-lysine N-methyltransferase, H3 lysine-79 specific [Terfezia boudieri ATCC MYA-4762]|uniref:Histone-lysine N-methyltransferase, H3 lysine-79 specific n=1 Tax=Terfezia boudieri ATCC MYA-4762 TaxID=1051890 RepID=A0A3N4M408_9PEZI|nr:histone-lysine N-methyltransferase, H3 lysine-79 specific [Terfezia boudieri ATCC MYA-4762]